MDSENRQMNNQPTEKKKQNKLLYILLPIVILAVIAGIVLINLNGEKDPEEKQELSLIHI